MAIANNLHASIVHFSTQHIWLPESSAIVVCNIVPEVKPVLFWLLPNMALYIKLAVL